MCFVLLSFWFHKGTKIVLCVNRDEYFERLTHPTKFWDPPYANILGAQDEKGGTQFGVTKEGRFAVVTTYRHYPKGEQNTAVYHTSRGTLALEYLRGKQSIESLLAELQNSASEYDGYNIIVGDVNEAWYFSNKSSRPPTKLERGHVYGLSNAFLDSNWYKVRTGKEKLSCLEDVHKFDDLFNILSDTQQGCTEDAQVQASTTELDIETESKMAPTFVSAFTFRGKLFGTRSQHLFVVNSDGKAVFLDRQWTTGVVSPSNWVVHKEEFQVVPQ